MTAPSHPHSDDDIGFCIINAPAFYALHLRRSIEQFSLKGDYIGRILLTKARRYSACSCPWELHNFASITHLSISILRAPLSLFTASSSFAFRRCDRAGKRTICPLAHMPNPSGRNPSRDFVFESTDQSFAHHLGGAEGAPQTAFPPQPHERYEAEQATDAPARSATPNQGGAQDSSLRYPDFGAHQSSVAHQQAPAPFSGYGYSPGGPLVWDWGNAIDFPDFTSHYEPQGELAQELQTQNVPANNFSIPLPVTNPETAFQSPQPVSSAHSTTVQNPLSPPPRPLPKPSVQTGMKRKADSEPNSAVSQTASAAAEPQQKPAKRPNKSRSSSTTSVTSPVVGTTATATTAATTAAADARPSLMTASSTASAAADGKPQADSSTNNEVQKRKEPSKGTGPQGRVIDVSRPRRIVESPGGADMLPAGKVFPIQIGSELFRLSGASISSDGKHGT